MAIVLHLALSLLAAVTECSCVQLDSSDYRLNDILDGCEWITKRNVVYDMLLNRYRSYAIHNFFQLDDICAVYEWNKNLKNAGTSEQNGSDESKEKLTEGDPHSQEQTAEITSPEDHIDEKINSSCGRSAKETYLCLSNILEDPVLDAMILDNLELICDPRHSSHSHIKKRNSKYVSKQKFHSWGGKRQVSNVVVPWNGKQPESPPFFSWAGKRQDGTVFFPWGGKRSISNGRIQRQPKVVIRNPFHAWGGKRNQHTETRL
ncbi:leucokinins-like [Wyeomyia smithii]|uniref:leucokinins-like n=1 Tax=Wyeomyia smithii TaxID=174621 RepID=UPI002467D0D3|nr:leucokinins-like [Wyeomyia smithii]